MRIISHSTDLKGTRLVAKKREHLWVAEVSKSLEEFRDYYLLESKNWLKFYQNKLRTLMSTFHMLDVGAWNKPQIDDELIRSRDLLFSVLDVIDIVTRITYGVWLRVIKLQSAKKHVSILEKENIL